jgi:2'-5' RNA ligase
MTEPHTSGLIVALPADDDPINQHQPGQDPDPHVTMCWFGPAEDLDSDQRAAIRSVVEAISSITDPFDAKVSGNATLGDENAKVLLIESEELSNLRELLKTTKPIGLAMDQVEQFPNFLPHITWSYQDEPSSMPETVKVGKLGVWMGDEREEFPFGNPELDALSAAAEPTDQILTPETSDVAPLFLALTDAVDKDAVLDVLALVPASDTSSQPIVYSRSDGGWQLDDEMRTAMLSTNPPPIVRLDDETAKNVIEQVDSYFVRKGEENVKDGKDGKDGKTGKPGGPGGGGGKPGLAADPFDELQVYSEFGDLFPVPTLDALYAAGGVDQNRGNAEKLRRYWTTGPGGAKIRWGTGGDWYRCVKHLSKYLGPRAKGYCQLRHKEATGTYTSTHAKMIRQGKGGRRASAADLAVINRAAMRAFVASGNTIQDIAANDIAPADAPEHGARFSIPLVVPEGVETGDGRRFAPLSLTTRELPLPLLWQLKTAEGHDGSVVVGRIDKIERIANGLGNATGVFDVGPYGKEVERLVRGKFLRGISADLDKFEATAEDNDELGEDGEPLHPNKIGSNKMLIDKARVSAITVVARPAFEECTISLIEDEDGIDV